MFTPTNRGCSSRVSWWRSLSRSNSLLLQLCLTLVAGLKLCGNKFECNKCFDYFILFFCLKCNCEAKNVPNLTTLDSGVLQKVVVLVALIFFLISQQTSPHFFFPEVLVRWFWDMVSGLKWFISVLSVLQQKPCYQRPSGPCLFLFTFSTPNTPEMSFYKTSSNSQYAKDCGY